MGLSRWLAVVAGWLWLLVAFSAWGQDVGLRVGEGPYYAGVSVDLEVVAKGFEESPQPDVRVESPAWGKLELVGVSPEVSSSVQIINGRMSQWKDVRFVFHYRFLADKTGTIVLGPFRVSQGGHEVATKTVTLKLGDVPTGGDQRVVMLLPEEPVFVGQRIPIRLQWWIEADLVERLVGHEARVPLFEMIDVFGFEEGDQGTQSNAMVIQSPQGPKKYPAEATKGVKDGHTWLVLTVDRILVPLKAGDFGIPAASVILEEGVRWKQSFFGGRSASQVRRSRVADTDRVIHVKALPDAGRPPSFAGAIGQGFTLEVAAERSVVHVGDPIHLTLTLKGNGSLETASLPPLVGGGGLSERDFRVPEGDLAGVVADGTKKFDVMVRVLREDVREIPPIAYSWFDTGKGQYETTYSRPIALSVAAAKMVSAGDVVRGEDAQREEKAGVSGGVTPGKDRKEDAKNGQSGPSAAETKTDSAADQATLVGADLAIERDVNVLLGRGGSVWFLVLVQWGGYLGGMGLLGYAFWWSRRARLDPVVSHRVKTLKGLMTGIENVATPGELADVLRRMAAVAEGVPRGELDALLEALDNLAYSPQGGKGSVAAELKSRAVALARRMRGG